MLKKAYSIQMSYTVTDQEKMIAEKALLRFKHAKKTLEAASDYLNIMNTPFKDNTEMAPEEVYKARAALRRFRDTCVENFNKFKEVSYKCVDIMENFSSDTQTVKLMKSFINSIDDLESKVNKFIDLFDDLKDKEFGKNIVSSINEIKKQCDDVNSIINERIKSHIEKNILSSNWTNDVGNRLKTQIDKKKPMIIRLLEEDQKNSNQTFDDILSERD